MDRVHDAGTQCSEVEKDKAKKTEGRRRDGDPTAPPGGGEVAGLEHLQGSVRHIQSEVS